MSDICVAAAIALVGLTGCVLALARPDNRVHDGWLTVTVTDDGVGLTPASGSGGNGLATMRERAEELGGWLRLESAPGATRITASLPLPAAHGVDR